MSYTKVQWYQTREYIFWFFCVYLLTGSNLEIPSTITIIPKIIMLLRSAIMGRNGRVVLGAYFQMVFSADLAHFLFKVYNYFITHLLFGPDFTVQPSSSPVLWYEVSPHKCQQKPSFSDVQKVFPPYTGVKSSNDPTYLVLKSKASCLPNLESALIL